MKSPTILLVALLTQLSQVDAQSISNGSIHRLPEKAAAETISLNPEFWVFGEESKAPGEKLPLLITLHGGGSTGLDINKAKGLPSRLFKALEENEISALIVAPQAAKSPIKEGGMNGGWVPEDLNLLLAHVLETFPVDPDRVYLTGTSMGGLGTYLWAGTAPHHFAAIAPVVGGIGRNGPRDITPNLDAWAQNLATLPMKTFYGAQDRVVPADRGTMMVEAIKNAGGKQAELIVYDDLGHNAGTRVYSSPEFYQWLFSHRRAGP